MTHGCGQFKAGVRGDRALKGMSYSIQPLTIHFMTLFLTYLIMPEFCWV